MYVDLDNIEGAVMQATKNTCYEGGQLEAISADLEATQIVLARLIDAIAKKKVFTDDELVKIIGGY
jgi:hypothetical protein